MERTHQLKTQLTIRLGEIAQLIGADALLIEVFGGGLIAAVQQSRKQPGTIEMGRTRQRVFSQGQLAQPAIEARRPRASSFKLGRREP